MRTLIGGVLVLVLIAGVYYLYSTQTDREHDDSLGAIPTFSSADFAWHIEKVENFDDTNPKHIVSLDVKGKRYSVGEYAGCDVTSNSLLEPGEITRQTCWLAGAGNHISVFFEDDRYVVKERWIQESGGEEGVPTEGNFELLFVIER